MKVSPIDPNKPVQDPADIKLKEIVEKQNIYEAASNPAVQQLSPKAPVVDTDKITNPNGTPAAIALEKDQEAKLFMKLLMASNIEELAVALERFKRKQYRVFFETLYVKHDAMGGFMSKINEQRLRILFTWLARFRAEHKFQNIRMLANIQYKDFLALRKDAFIRGLKWERVVEERKILLEKSIPKFEVKPQSLVIREENLVRMKHEIIKDKILDQADHRVKLAQYLAATNAMTKIIKHDQMENEIGSDLNDHKKLVKKLTKAS